VVLALLALDALLARARASGESEEARWFALGIAAMAMLLMVVPEFVFVRDMFGTRMNTVFKLYFQAWALMAVAGAFGAVWLMQRLPFAGAWMWTVFLAIGLSLSILYPVAATWTKVGMFRGEATLDGTRWYQTHPDYPAAAWLMANEPAQVIVLEGTKPNAAYEFDVARVATLTGLSTVLGWGNHELQWRGNYDEPGRRTPLIERIYTTTDPEEAQRLLDAFDVRYVGAGDVALADTSLAGAFGCAGGGVAGAGRGRIAPPGGAGALAAFCTRSSRGAGCRGAICTPSACFCPRCASAFAQLGGGEHVALWYE